MSWYLQRLKSRLRAGAHIRKSLERHSFSHCWAIALFRRRAAKKLIPTLDMKGSCGSVLCPVRRWCLGRDCALCARAPAERVRPGGV